MARMIPAACIAAIILAFVDIGAGKADDLAPLQLRIANGQTVQQALFQARLRARLGAPHARLAGRRDSQTFDPVITAGALLSGTVTVGQSNSFPVLQFTYQTDKAGLAGAEFTFTAPDGVQSMTYSYYVQGYSKTATAVFTADVNAPYFAQPGQWTLTYAFIEDNQFNYTQYDQAQLASLFSNPYVTVVNSGPVDITPPVVTAGKILTPKVSLKDPEPTFKATLTGTDDVSGMLNAFVLIQPPGGTFSNTALYNAPYPLLSGTLHAYSPIFSGQPAGTWTITGYELCDVALNCFNDSNESDVTKLFGTDTFTVTD